MEAGTRGCRRRDAFIVQSDTPPPFLVKQLTIKQISARSANEIIKKLHYSGKVVPNSKLHFGVFCGDKCGGAIQFGPSMRKDLILRLVDGTKWNEFIELNRMALADWLPRNSESKSISCCIRFIKKNYPFIKWVVSFADGTQCGDGTIYRASGFVLTGIKKNTQMAIDPITGNVIHKIAAYHNGKEYDHAKWEKVSGYMLRYIYFIDPTARERLTVPILPFSEIGRRGAGMYKGVPKARPESDTSDTIPVQGVEGGSRPTSGL